jgi:hypothetical protein
LLPFSFSLRVFANENEMVGALIARPPSSIGA